MNTSRHTGRNRFGCSTLSSSWSQSRLLSSSLSESVIPGPTTTNQQDLKIITWEEYSGLQFTWRLWRHCCCRYGWYPLLIATMVITGCLLSIYSAYGCDFLRVEIGFIPSNGILNQAGSSIEFGIFSYQSRRVLLETNNSPQSLLDGCRIYSDQFSDVFIDEDRAWRVARIMSYISGIAGIVGSATSILFVISPLPASFFWPGVLMPSLVVAFLSESSKFLLFDGSVCRDTVWISAGSNTLPQAAESCSMGSTSYCCITAWVIFFFSILLVCLKAPSKRILDSDYGIHTMILFPTPVEGSPISPIQSEEESFGRRHDSSSEDPIFSGSQVRSMLDDRSEIHLSMGFSNCTSEDLGRNDSENPLDSMESLSGYFSPCNPSSVSEWLRPLDGNDDRHSPYSIKSSPMEEDEDRSSSSSSTRSQSPTTNKGAKIIDHVVSESPLQTAERMQVVTSSLERRDLNKRFLKEMDHSFEQNWDASHTKDGGNENEDDLHFLQSPHHLISISSRHSI